MSSLELVALLLALASLIARFLARPALPWLLGGAVAAMVGAIALNPARWPLYPALLALALVALLLRPRRRFPKLIAVTAALLLGLSATLAQLFAMPALPAPRGPYAVGTTNVELTRSGRE